jgi:hypothetical protein
MKKLIILILILSVITLYSCTNKDKSAIDGGI